MLYPLLFLLLGPQSDSVIICTGANSTRYHTTTNCHGLASCHWHIKKVSVQDAENMHRHLCGYCARRKKEPVQLPDIDPAKLTPPE